MDAILAFLRSGFTTDKGELDDARVAAFFLVVSYIFLGVYGICHTPIKDLAALGAFMQSYGVGGAALAAGIGGWFGFRKSN